MSKHYLLAALAALTFSTGLAQAATEVVTEGDVTRQVENTPPTDNWVLYTRAGTPPTAGAFVNGPGTPPAGVGSLQLTTATGAEKVYLFNYDHVGKPITGIDDIIYHTYRTAGSAQQVAALNVQIDFNGSAPGGFSTLVFEPVYNTTQGAVVSGEWQDWIADGSGIWWSTQPIIGQCAGATAACDQTWDYIVANNPNATILGVGINQGSGNPGLISNVDAFTFDEVTYDFESPDTDGDGVVDSDDECVPSDLRSKVDANGNEPGETSIDNEPNVNGKGCSIQDLVNAAAVNAQNHGQYVSAIAHLANDLRKAGIITNAQSSELKRAAAQSDIGKK